MPLNIQHFSDLTQSQIDQAYNVIVQMVQEKDPSIDAKRGVIKDLVLHLSSILTAANQANIDLVRRSNSLKAIQEGPELADPDLVDRVASNYRITRLEGAPAQGPVVVVLDEPKTVTVPQGAIFIAQNSLTFTTDAAYTCHTDAAAVVTPNDRLLFNLGNGTYSFVVNVTSDKTGRVYRLPVNTSLSPPFIDPAVQGAYTAADFTGGTDQESNQELLNRLKAGISSKSLSNRPSIEGLVRLAGRFDESFAVSTVGYGDREMQRYHSILPVAFGGRADVYVRTAATVRRVDAVKSARLVSTNAGQGVWQFTFGRDEWPGFYEVVRITQVGSINNVSVVGYQVSSDVRGYDLAVGTTPGTNFLPDLANPVEAGYSRYQTVTVQFVDADTPLAGLVVGTSTRDYEIRLAQLPDIEVVQDVLSDRQSRYPVGDCLVKAPVPCFVSATVNVGKRTVDAQPDLTAVRNAAADVVNRLGFVGRIPTSLVVSAVQKALTAGAVTSLTLQGRVRRPDGVVQNISSTTVLDVGNDPLSLVSDRTVGFFLDPADVTVVVSNVDSPSA